MVFITENIKSVEAACPDLIISERRDGHSYFDNNPCRIRTSAKSFKRSRLQTHIRRQNVLLDQ